jgi:hypothetical protein
LSKKNIGSGKLEYIAFIKKMHRRVAQTCVGSSSIRNQGAKGLIDTCRTFFEREINLNEFAKELVTGNYDLYLNNLTNILKNRFGKGGQSSGAARKGLNLFFRDVVYNMYLVDYLKLPSLYSENLSTIRNLEIPLDKDVGSNLNLLYPDLPKWDSIKNLDINVSNLFQAKALDYADSRGIARVHLDLEFWRKDKNIN